ncbi:hypothetical protein LSH36_664g00000 [Paralvinella palmiformis]|uniref:Serine/threonine-protein phosphatase PGAM5, mitochondrial n=1 Tax=Paralvinella palmiformis TaxID=53620 RepID=A0AAD9J3Y7_9ANNE|nr:hypothetical protein LSH36_664g00000 [Paralvinella palmiformis]
MGTDGSSICTSRSFIAGMTRNVFVALAIVMALILLLWLNKEHDIVAKCRDFESWQKAAITPDQPKVHVDIEKEASNESQHTATHSVESQKWNYNWDHKAWPHPEDAVGVPTRTLILVRHGQYDFSSGLLNDKGHQQANITGMRLKHLGMKYSRIIHSDQTRAKETATIIHQHLPQLPMEEDPLLAEGGPTPPEPTVNYWSLPERSYFVDGPRLEAAFRKYFYRADKSQQLESIDVLYEDDD